jgi:signal transduction histidine kinase
MTADERARIGPFVQFGRDRREQQGLGLGLAIVRLVAARSGGGFRLAASPAGGTRAELDLPLAAS